MIEKNKVYELTATDLTIEGKGVGRVEGMAVFVEGLLPGETGEARITKLAKSYAEAELVRRISDSPDRVLPPCPYFGDCGGCQLQHSSYIGQLNYKNSRVESCMRKIAKMPDDVVLNFPLPAREHFGYRNKASLPISQGKDGIEIGYYKEKSHNLIDIEKCALLPQEMNDAITLVRDWANEYKISAYDERTGRGLLRHLILRYSHVGEMMVGLVINGEEIPYAKALIRNLRLNLPEVFSVVQNVNKKRGSAILGSETKVLFGSERILEEISGLEFDISLNTFLQVNHAQTELLYQTVFRLARILPGEVVVDLYCGAGTISLCAAKLAGKVYGIEIVPEAVRDAKANAEKNGITNAEFYCADCAAGFEKVAERAGKIDVVIVDPPRKGLEKKVIDDIVKNAPGRIVYVSCDPATLARDLALFGERGFAPRFIQPVDMFPQTAHVETAVLLCRSKKDG